MSSSTQATSALRKMNYELMWDPCYGYLSSCPSNLGTGLVASVGIRLPTLSGRPELLKGICDEYCLESHPARKGSIQADETPGMLVITTQRVLPPSEAARFCTRLPQICALPLDCAAHRL